MNEAALREWIEQRLAEGEDATVYEFIREVLDRSEGASAKVGEHEATIEKMKGEIARLKSHNYDLMMMGGSVDDDDEINSGDGEVLENAEDDGEIYHIDNLFMDDEDERKDD